MDDSTEQGDCCPISGAEIEQKGIAFGPRQVRPDSFDAYVDKESARARARMLGCIGIRQYSSTAGGTVWMPCSNESDYRKVTGQDNLSRRQRRRMLKTFFTDGLETKALGSTIGAVSGQVNTNPFTAIDADLDGLVLEGLAHINMGRGVPDPTPGGAQIPSAPTSPLRRMDRSPFQVTNDDFAIAAMSNRTRPTQEVPTPPVRKRDRRMNRPSAKLRMEQYRDNVEAALKDDLFANSWQKAVADFIDADALGDDDSDQYLKQNLYSIVEDVASRVESAVDEQPEFSVPRGRTRRDAADATSARLTAKVLGTVSELMNNPPDAMTGRDDVVRRLTSSLLESGARRVADTGGKPGVWAFLIQAILGGAIGVQGGWELLARIFGIENSTGWIPHPTGRSLEILSPSLARQRSNEARSRALERVTRTMDALRDAGFAIADAGDIPSVADDIAEVLDGDRSTDLPGDLLPKDTAKSSSLDEVIRKMREATGIRDSVATRRRRDPRTYVEEDLITRNRMDLVGIPTGILDVFDSSSVPAPTPSDGSAARLIASGGVDGLNPMNAKLLYDAMSDQNFLRTFVAPTDSPYAAQLATLVEQGRLPKVAAAILEMSPESVEDFLAVNPRPLILSARSARKKLRPAGSWVTRIDHDPFEVAAHLMRAKDYHISAIANGSDSPVLLDAVDELVGNNASETSAIFSAMVANNKQRLADAYDGSLQLARSGNGLLMAARNLISNATENDSTWSASRNAITQASRAMVSAGDVSAGMTNTASRYGRNYPRHRRKSGDWSPIANKIRDSIKRYKSRYGAPAANSADLARFVDFSYPELLDEAAELIDLMKQKIEFGSLAMADYASDGWRNRDVAELALDEFDPTNLESIFDPGSRMGLLKAIGVNLAAAAKMAPSRSERDGVMDILDEVNSWSFTVLPLYTEPRSVTSRRRGIFPSVSADAEAGMTVNRGVPEDIRQTLMSRSAPLGSGTEGTPKIRMRRKLIERANELLAAKQSDDLVDRIGMDPKGPVIDIAETFLVTAEQFRWDQQTTASFYEDVAEMMNEMVQEVPNPKKRQLLADMFTDALEDIAENMDDGNTEFFASTGDIPSRTVGRLARRLGRTDQPRARSDSEAGMVGPDDEPRAIVEPMPEFPDDEPRAIVEPMPELPPTPPRRRMTDGEMVTIYGEVQRIFRSLDNPNISKNPNDAASWREKMRAAGINIPFSSDEGLDEVADQTLPDAPDDPRAVFSDPFAGVSQDAVRYLDDLMSIVLEEIGASVSSTTEDFVRDLRRRTGVRNSSEFHDLVRALSTSDGRATLADFSEQVMENNYLTTSAIKKRMTDRFPDFYDVMDYSGSGGGDAEAGMSGPIVDRIRERYVAQRKIRELGGVAKMNDEKDYKMRQTEARRRRLLSMTEPDGFFDFVTRGVTDQRSPLYLRPIAERMGGLYKYIKEMSDAQVDATWQALENFVNQARRDMFTGGLSSPYMTLYNAAKAKTTMDDPDFRPDGGRFSDDELLSKMEMNSWDEILPPPLDMTISESDIDAVPSFKAKAQAALEVLAIDRAQLMELLTGAETSEEARGKLSEEVETQERNVRQTIAKRAGKVEYVPTQLHMEQIAAADAITPLDSESLVAFVSTLDGAQLSYVSSASISTEQAKELVKAESRAISFASASRKLFAIRSLADLEPEEATFFRSKASQLIGDATISEPVKKLITAVVGDDDVAASQALSEIEPTDDNENSLVKVMWEMGRNSKGTFVTALLPPSIDEAERDATLRAKALGVLKSQPDGGRAMARRTIDHLPKDGRGYEPVRVVPEPGEGEAKIISLAEAIRAYDGTPESAARIVEAMTDSQIERLRNNYIIPSIIQRMDRKAYEARLEQSSIAQTRARIDNLGRRLELLTFGTVDSGNTVEEIISRTDEALSKAFGDKVSDLSMLTREERSYYGDIIDYFISGGTEIFDDPSQYGMASRAMKEATAEVPENPTLPPLDPNPDAPPPPDDGSVTNVAPDAPKSDDDGFWDSMGIEAGMAPPTPGPPVPPDEPSKRRLEAMPEETARKLFGDDIAGFVREGTWTFGDPTFPRTAIPEEATLARKVISALFAVQQGEMPDDVAERMRSEGIYSAAQLIFRALSARTLEKIRNMPDPPYDFPAGPYDPRSDKDKDRQSFFLAAMQEYVSLHLALGGGALPIYDDAPGREPSRYSFELTREDFQMVIQDDDLMNYRLIYNPGQPNEAVRADEAVVAREEFVGDPSEHPLIQSIDRTLSHLRRQFPAFSDWLDQDNRYSRILGGMHYEKLDDSGQPRFGTGIIDLVRADPSSMDLEKVIREVVDQFVDQHSLLGVDGSRLVADARSLGPDPDDASPFPSMTSYPSPDYVETFSKPAADIARHKKIATSTAKASAAARQSWWTMFTTGTLMDQFEIAAVAVTDKGDNFHPDAILAGLRKYARDNNLAGQFDAYLGAAQAAASARFNSVALQTIQNTLNEMARNRGGIKGELLRLAKLQKTLEKHYKELSRHYQDRIRAKIQSIYSAWALLYGSWVDERKLVDGKVAKGQMTSQQAVDHLQKLYFDMQPTMYAAVNMIADLSRKAAASDRARTAVERQQEEIRERIEEIREAARLTGRDAEAGMALMRGINNAFDNLAEDPSGLSDDYKAGSSIGRSTFGVVGGDRVGAPRARRLLTTNEKKLASAISRMNDMFSQNNVDEIGQVPSIRAAMETLRGGRPDRVVPQIRTGDPGEIEQAKVTAAMMMRADAEAEATTRRILGARFKRFSDLAMNTLPGLTRRVVEDIVVDGVAEAMRANAVREADLDAALTMYSEAIRNVKYMSVFNPVQRTADILNLEPDDVSDAIATESMILKTSNLLRMAQSYASSLSGAYGRNSVLRMTNNRFPELRNFGSLFLESIFASPSDASSRKLNSAISLNKLMRFNSRAAAAAFGVSDDVAQVISASAAPRTRPTELSNPLPHDWNFMTFRDRQSWLGSEEAFNSLGRAGVNDELSKLQSQIEDFGSMDGPYPALARIITGNATGTGAFGRQLITADGRSPIFSSVGFGRGDMVRNGRNQISALMGAVPGISQMSDRALSRFLGAPYDVVAEFRRDGAAASPEAAERLALAFGKISSEVWPPDAPQSDADPGNFYWLGSTWDRSGEIIAAIGEGADQYAVAADMPNGQFVAERVTQLVEDGTVGRFYDQVGLEEITTEDAQSFVASIAPRSRKGVVEILASSGYREQDIIDATGFNPNTVRNSLHELRKQGLLPEVVGSPRWIARNGDAVVADFSSGLSKRALMKKYGIGAKTLDSIIGSSRDGSRMDDAYGDAEAGMSNRRLPDNTPMSDGPQPDWRDERQTRADGTLVDRETQSPPANVANPFVTPGSPASLGLNGEIKDPERMQNWARALSAWISFALEGGYFKNRTEEMSQSELIMAGIFGDSGSPGFEEAEFEIGMTDPVRGKRFKAFEIATRQDNPANELLSVNAVPSIIRPQFDATGVYTGILPMLRGMILATYDKYFKKLSDREMGSWEGVSTQDLVDAGLLDEPEMPRDASDELRLKLWQLRQMMRNPNMVDAPPLFEPGDEVVMRTIIPLMANADEMNTMRAQHGASPEGILGDPADRIQSSTISGVELWRGTRDAEFEEMALTGVPMFSNLLLGSVVTGDLGARKIVDNLTPRQIMLSNWVYGMYTALEPLVNAFAEMMPMKRFRSASPNLPDEPGASIMLGDPLYLPTREVDDQVFAFAFDSLFKALQGVSESPEMTILESLPSGEFEQLYGGDPGTNPSKAEALRMSTKVLARILADVLATGIYRKAVQSIAKDDDGRTSPFYKEEMQTDWFRLARPRVDSFGYWSMYGPNIVYAGTGGDIYEPGWNDQTNPISELGRNGAQLAADAVKADKEAMLQLQRVIDETPGKYWWETEAAYGELTDDQILNMHPEEFADYVASLSMYGEGELDDEKASQMLTRLVGRLSAMGYPKAELDRFDEWIGPIISGMPEGTVTKESVLRQLKNIFPWLDIDRMDDIYPVVGTSFNEAVNEMRRTLGGLGPETLSAVYRGRGQLRLAAESANRALTPDADREKALQQMNLYVIPVIKGLMALHRTNIEIGFRQVASFAEGLKRLTEATPMSGIQRELMTIASLLDDLREKGSINDVTHSKLMMEIARAGATTMFGDLEFGNTVMDAIANGSADDVMTFMMLIDDAVSDSVEEDKRREFIDKYKGYMTAAQNTFGDAFGQYVRSGFYGSVKTIGEAVREMEPFILATERARKRRTLLQRYKREVIDPVKDSLLTDEEKFKNLRTFNEWLDASGFPDLTYDKGGSGGDGEAAMSALTRTVMARFTDDAASAVIEGYEDSAKSGSSRLNLGHMLSGAWRALMTDTRPGSYASKLRRLNIRPDRMAAALASITTPKDGPSPKPTDYSTAAKNAMIGAIRAATRRGDEFIDLGDLLQAILDPSLRGREDDGVDEALKVADISPNVIRMALAQSRISGGREPLPDAEAGMSASRMALNSADRRDDLKRNKMLANGMWFNSDRQIPVATGTATDGQLVDEVERLMNIYAIGAARSELEPVDFRGGESPFSNAAIRQTNSRLIHGDNGQEPTDLVGAIRHAMDRADALLTDGMEQRRFHELKSKMRLYFDNDEHMPDESGDAEAGMTRNFNEMIEPINDNFGRSEKMGQKQYYEGIYGDADLSEAELRKAADVASLGSPFDISRNLDGNEDDVNWSTSQWSFNKDQTYVEAADSVMIRMRDGDLATAEIAMISRKSGPFRDAMALVGGLRDEGEDFMTTAARETAEEVGVSLERALQAQYIGTIESPDWDPRFVNGAKVGAGMFVLPWDTSLVAASDAAGARWVPLSEIAAGQHRLAFGHAEWIRRAVAAMQIDPSSDPYGDIRLSIAKRLGLLSKAARVRNQKMIAMVNLVRRATGKKLFPEQGDMPHPMMPWGNKVASSSWRFGPDAEAGMSASPIDDSLPRELGLLSVQSTMPASLLEKGADTAGFYKVGHSRGGGVDPVSADDLFAAWGDKTRVESLWRPYVELSLERARKGDVPNDQQRPTVYILGGASGVGKSLARKTGLSGIPNYDSAVVADPDDAKAMMPEARLWYARRMPNAAPLVHPESRQVAAVMARAATKEGLDLVYDTSGQFNDGFRDITDWRKMGYDLVAHYFFAPESTLQRRVIERQEQFGRGVPQHIVSTIQWNLKQMIPDFIGRQLFDELYIWDTEKDPERPQLVGQVLLGQQGQPSTLEVKHPYLFRYLFEDRTAPDGGKIEPRKTKVITIPFGK